ncbi:MAG: DASS family sodium-coupled anion symporter [Candidatus Bathyarchaeota archaeon]|nr:DASS family sodium-coupled anion symporter [Candidatus Bathyarchaeota archaeon]
MDKKRIITLAAVTLLAVIAFTQTSSFLTIEQRYAMVVLVYASGLWVTEAVPLAATAILIPLLQAFFGIQGFKAALVPFFDTTVMLLLGGFMLAVAVEKYDLDEYFAYLILSKVKAGAKGIVLAVMFATGFLSMWISNSASAALLITMALKITDQVKDKQGNFSKIMVLAIAYSATAGGLSTLVGTTTCAMAAASLKTTVGYDISFLGWMVYGAPIAVLQILVIWVVLFMIFPTDVKEIPPIERPPSELSNKQKLTLGVFTFAVLAWLTGKLPDPIANVIGWSGHGYSSSMVAATVLILLYFTDLIEEQDIKNGKWSTLLLIGGGLSLGAALEVTGLVNVISDWLMGLTSGGSPLLAIIIVVVSGLGISIIASNTASAGIFLPIAIGLGQKIGFSPVILAVAVGISTSLDFMLPVGTPPNAIAYSTGKVSMPEMIKAGILLDISGAILTIIMAYLLWPYLI